MEDVPAKWKLVQESLEEGEWIESEQNDRQYDKEYKEKQSYEGVRTMFLSEVLNVSRIVETQGIEEVVSIQTVDFSRD